MKKLNIIWALVIMLSGFAANAQDSQFSQFYSNPISLNPALAGTSQSYRVIASHRHQWVKSLGFVTSAFSLDAPLGSGNTGWGMQVVRDSEAGGILNTTSASGSFSHRINVSKKSQLGLGLKVGMYQKALNLDGLTFEDQLDKRHGIVNGTNEQIENSNVVNADLSLGLLYFSENFIAGVSVNHINSPKEEFVMDSENELNIKYTVHMGGFIPVGNFRSTQEQVLSPNIIYERQGTFNYLNLGMYYSSESIMLGAWYRLNDAVIASVGININDFRVGYSYDISVSDHSVNGNSHEFTATYQFKLPKKHKIKNRYKGQCPKFQKHLF